MGWGDVLDARDEARERIVALEDAVRRLLVTSLPSRTPEEHEAARAYALELLEKRV